ncbi:hypothetical protein V493_07614, partial [Pseudogymnoascus sp. VKM F-4281 (FW-2241)]
MRVSVFCWWVVSAAAAAVGVVGVGVGVVVADAMAVPFIVPFSMDTAAVPFCAPGLLEFPFTAAPVDVAMPTPAAETGTPNNNPAALRTSGGDGEIRSSGQNPGFWIARRACRAQVRQRFEPGGAVGEAASHL